MENTESSQSLQAHYSAHPAPIYAGVCRCTSRVGGCVGKMAYFGPVGRFDWKGGRR